MKKILVASHNLAKIAEISALLHDAGFQSVSLHDVGITHEVDETGSSYEENAIIKAKAYADMTGMIAMADDSGIEIAALPGQMGVYTKQFAPQCSTDEEKRQVLLATMAHVPQEKRAAVFITVIAIAWPDGMTQIYRGQITGKIAFNARGVSRVGYPYANIFEVGDTGKTYLELHQEGIEFKTHRILAIQSAIQDLLSRSLHSLE